MEKSSRSIFGAAVLASDSKTISAEMTSFAGVCVGGGRNKSELWHRKLNMKTTWLFRLNRIHIKIEFNRFPRIP